MIRRTAPLQRRHDVPEALSNSINSICPTSADGKHNIADWCRTVRYEWSGRLFRLSGPRMQNAFSTASAKMACQRSNSIPCDWARLPMAAYWLFAPAPWTASHVGYGLNSEVAPSASRAGRAFQPSARGAVCFVPGVEIPRTTHEGMSASMCAESD